MSAATAGPAQDARAAIAAAIGALTLTDLDRLGAWQPLADLSSATRLEGIDGDPDAVSVTGDRFQAIANVHVVLDYGSGSEDGDAFDDAYVATLSGTLSADGPVVTAASVDVSPFYD